MLSDACFEFLYSVGEAAGILAKAVHHYSEPDGPFGYGAEIDTLRRACAAVKERPYDAEAAAVLLRLAASVMTFHDTPPETPGKAVGSSLPSTRLASVTVGSVPPRP